MLSNRKTIHENVLCSVLWKPVAILCHSLCVHTDQDNTPGRRRRRVQNCLRNVLIAVFKPENLANNNTTVVALLVLLHFAIRRRTGPPKLSLVLVLVVKENGKLRFYRFVTTWTLRGLFCRGSYQLEATSSCSAQPNCNKPPPLKCTCLLPCLEDPQELLFATLLTQRHEEENFTTDSPQTFDTWSGNWRGFEEFSYSYC